MELGIAIFLLSTVGLAVVYAIKGDHEERKGGRYALIAFAIVGFILAMAFLIGFILAAMAFLIGFLRG